VANLIGLVTGNGENVDLPMAFFVAMGLVALYLGVRALMEPNRVTIHDDGSADFAGVLYRVRVGAGEIQGIHPVKRPIGLEDYETGAFRIVHQRGHVDVPFSKDTDELVSRLLAANPGISVDLGRAQSSKQKG
jgi:hypothetical protein